MHTAILIGGFSCLDTMKLTQRRASIKREPNGRQTVTTEAFVSQLALINFHWSCRQANQWIETYVTVFKDISTQEGENRTFMLFNPNGGR
uniref:DNA polymerase V n=1 Tax=Escherichia coli TaxID=562 RepID=A0A7U2GZE6_ECOLX|nr:DNA polymerase V [Escherichia coli]